MLTSENVSQFDSELQWKGDPVVDYRKKPETTVDVKVIDGNKTKKDKNDEKGDDGYKKNDQRSENKGRKENRDGNENDHKNEKKGKSNNDRRKEEDRKSESIYSILNDKF